MLLDREGPAAFRGRETTARVLIAAGPYRLSGEWWREDGQLSRRAYWDVHASDGAVYRVHQDRARRPLVPRWLLRLASPADSRCAATFNVKSDYVELRCRSAFSFLDGASLPEDLVAAAASGGHDALALADRDGVYGAPRFFAAARKTGLRPIVGAEITLAAGAAPVLLLVEDRRGYQNLCQLITAAKDRESTSPIRSTRPPICWRRTRAG